ncbi:hypothetical protein [Pyrococcus yayanosii]|uniref:Alpha-glucosidase n=1 Tax=Pyrococcus yayanosii (strain CH1 / JCM 16557) TaxID=529709 RepID=F8AEK1_PYRYC|nr:hypothetical protein [Pyrococcus yayanosii]AEH24680.1 hypothetical protein PYCH_09970 [Pyrococcus yayanosii CH1]
MKSSAILKEVAENLKLTVERLNKVKALEEKDKKKAIRLLMEASDNFLRLSDEVEIDNEQLAEFFRKRSVQLKNNAHDKGIERMGRKEFLNEVKRMNLYSKAAPYDFKPGKLRELKRAYRTFIFGMALYFLLSGLSLRQEFAITGLILAIPAILSMLSLQRRGYTGWMLAFAVAPIPIIQSAIIVRMFYSVVSNPEVVKKVAEFLGKSEGFVMGYSYAVMLLATLDFILLTYGLYSLYKHRHAFL